MKKNVTSVKKSNSGEFPSSYISLPLFLIPLPEVVKKLRIEKIDKITAYVCKQRKVTVPQPDEKGVDDDVLTIENFMSNVCEPPNEQDKKEIRLVLKTTRKKKTLKPVKRFNSRIFSVKSRGDGSSGGLLILPPKGPVERVSSSRRELFEVKDKRIDISKMIKKIENFEVDGESDEDMSESDREDELETDEETYTESGLLSPVKTEKDLMEQGIDDILGYSNSMFMKDVDGQVMKSLRRKVNVFVRTQKHKRREMNRENQKQAKRHLQFIAKKLQSPMKAYAKKRINNRTPRTPRTPRSTLSKQKKEEKDRNKNNNEKQKPGLLEPPVSPIRQRSNSEKVSNDDETVDDHRPSSLKKEELSKKEIEAPKKNVTFKTELVTSPSTKKRNGKPNQKKEEDSQDQATSAKGMAKRLRKLNSEVDKCLNYHHQQELQRSSQSKRYRTTNYKDDVSYSLLNSSKSPYMMNSKRFRGTVDSYNQQIRNRNKKLRKMFPDIKPLMPLVGINSNTKSNRITLQFHRSPTSPPNSPPNKKRKSKRRNAPLSRRWKNKTNRMYENEREYVSSLPRVHRFKRSLNQSRRNNRRDIYSSMGFRRTNLNKKQEKSILFPRSHTTPSTLLSSPREFSPRRKKPSPKKNKNLGRKKRPKSAVIRRRGMREIISNTNFMEKHFRRRINTSSSNTEQPHPITTINNNNNNSKKINNNSRPFTSPNPVNNNNNNNSNIQIPSGRNKNIFVAGSEGSLEMTWNSSPRNRKKKNGFGTVRVCRLADTLKGYKMYF